MSTTKDNKIKASKRDQVMEATLKLTAEKGVRATSTADIAKKANVGMGTIYRYFESKEILMTALFDELKQKFIQVIISNYNPQIDHHANFKNLVKVLVRYYIANPEEFSFLERYSDSTLRVGKSLDEFTKLVDHVKGMLTGTDHQYKFKQLPPLVLFAMTYGPLVAIVNLVLMDKLEINDQILDEIAEACWHSVLVQE